MQPSIATHRAADGYELHYRHWQPREPVLGQIVYLHGIQSHGGWYEGSCRRLCESGFEVFFLDRRGSGLNQVDRGHARDSRQLIDDVVGFIHRLCARAEAATWLGLIGVSWGGKLAAAVAAESPCPVEALALLYPGIGARVRPRWHQALALRLAWKFGAGRRTVTIPLDDPKLFTANPPWQRFIAEDPLSLRRASLSLLQASLELDALMRGLPPRIAVPTLMLLAGDDRIIDNAVNERFFQNLATHDKQQIIYPGAQHTLEFEPDPEPFFRDLVDWFIRQAGG